jgi:hypothetical protein|tara:strand:+ start:1167 stop:1820 length:654 start_codon:yes stop_codon:yes gene_type:complete
MSDFKTNKYTIIKNAISKELAEFAYNYLILKRKVARTLFDDNFIPPFETMLGVWNDPQVLETYSNYSDIVMETLLEKVKPIMEKQTGLNLCPTYSYARIYKKDDVLERHKDRMSCEISTTMNLGGDPWPIFLEPDETKGKNTDDGYVSENTVGVKIDLDPGDMLVYSGCVLEHWRDKFEGQNCAQVFLHYNNIETQGDKNKYDGRPHLGLPSDYKRG